jgi:hypothetical protein
MLRYFLLHSTLNPTASYNHFLMYHGPILLEDSVGLLLLQDQPFNSPTEDLGVDDNEVEHQGEDLNHIGCQPGEWIKSINQSAGIQRLPSQPANEQRGAELARFAQFP